MSWTMQARRLRIVLALLIGSQVLAATHAVPAPRYQYVARTLAAVLRSGEVRVGALQWHCGADRCEIAGPWEKPSVDACAALASVVGRIASYGRAGAMLSEKDLLACNAHAATGGLGSLQNPIPDRFPSRHDRTPLPSDGGLPPFGNGRGADKRDVLPPVTITSPELSAVGGSFCGVVSHGLAPVCISTGELSAVGGPVGHTATSEPPVAITSPELSAIGR